MICCQHILLAVVMVALTASSVFSKTTQRPKYQYTKKPGVYRDQPQTTMLPPATTSLPKMHKVPETTAPMIPQDNMDSTTYSNDLFPDYYTETTGPPGGGQDNYTLDYNECYFNFCECCPPERGPRGPRGEKGLTGAPGLKGDQGPQGPPGRAGVNGTAGPRGDRGERGDRGAQGASGAAGLPGKPGLKGETGSRGEPGHTGLPGVKGDRGEKGDPSLNGTKGEKGEPGGEGAAGLPGLTGELGLKGDKGDQGECGTYGERGQKGDRGDPGPPGFQGAMGHPGMDGKPGPPGVEGVQGNPGPPGVQGEPGVRGIPGNPGVRGMFGPKGERGSPGMRGERGLRGLKGAKGAAVPQQRSAFSVGLSPSKSFPHSGSPVRFDRIFYNGEEHYNTSSSSFTCAHAGVYVFSFHVTVRNRPLRAALVVNGARRVRTRDSLYGQDIDQASNLVLLRLAVGDQVWLETLRDWNGVYSSSEDDSIFSGFLLYPDKP